MLRYKGYNGRASYSPEDAVFHGKLLGIRVLERSLTAVPRLLAARW